MGQNGKILFISVFVLISILSTFLIFKLTIYDSFQELKQGRYRGTDEDIIRYVKDTHDIDVEVVSNLGPKNIHNGGGATVRTTDERALAFVIEISIFNNIKSDTYTKESDVYTMNEALKSSEDIKKLEQIGVDSVEIQFPDTTSPWSNYEPYFYFYLMGDIRLSSEEMVQVVNEVLPVAEEWRETAKNEYQLDMEKIHFKSYDEENPQTVRLNIENTPKDSLEELEKYILENNINAFTQHLVTEEMEKITYLEEQFDTLQFSDMRNKEPLQCNHIQKLNECESYTLFVSYPSKSIVDLRNDFRYDDPKVKEMLFETIQMINDSESPITQLSIERLYRPSDLEKQYEAEEELREQSEERIIFDAMETLIKNLPDIKEVDDIIFEE